ncbi:hypothetical protein FB451DRAFT_1188252 [Mycena latifolia]|nr:hypothetical protein FB451DRAFT_1188252 [Mycena latifolia]
MSGGVGAAKWWELRPGQSRHYWELGRSLSASEIGGGAVEPPRARRKRNWIFSPSTQEQLTSRIRWSRPSGSSRAASASTPWVYLGIGFTLDLRERQADTSFAPSLVWVACGVGLVRKRAPNLASDVVHWARELSVGTRAIGSTYAAAAKADVQKMRAEAGMGVCNSPLSTLHSHIACPCNWTEKERRFFVVNSELLLVSGASAGTKFAEDHREAIGSLKWARARDAQGDEDSGTQRKSCCAVASTSAVRLAHDSKAFHARRGQVGQKQAHVPQIMELRQDKVQVRHMSKFGQPSGFHHRSLASGCFLFPPATISPRRTHSYDFKGPNVFIPQEQSLGLRTDNRDLVVHRDHSGGEGRTAAFTPASSARLAGINAPWDHTTSIWGQI